MLGCYTVKDRSHSQAVLPGRAAVAEQRGGELGAYGRPLFLGLLPSLDT